MSVIAISCWTASAMALISKENCPASRSPRKACDQPLVLFALEWCEFCWSLRKLFARCRIPYRSIDLDATAYQRNDRGGQIRAQLRARTGSKTIPQVFIGGEFIGGCTETLDAFKSGRLQQLLSQHGVPFDDNVQFDPYTLLPTWLHPR